MRLVTLLFAIAFLAAAAGPAMPAAAQSKETLRKLSEIYKLIQQDETGEAVKQLNAVLEGEPGDPDTAAKVMLLRGKAYAKADKPAQALSDFNASLWLKGLNAGQRKDALAGRKAALAKLGMEVDEDDPGASAETEVEDPTQTVSIPTSIPTSSESESSEEEQSSTPEQTVETEEPSAPKPSRDSDEPGVTATARAPTSGAWETDVQAAEEEQQESDAITSFFSDLFSSSDESDTAARTQTDSVTATSGWTADTTELTAEPSRSPRDGVRYRVQIASVGTREGAESEVKRLSRLLSDAMDGDTPRIVRTDTDAGNTYYRIMVGPKPTRSAADAMCDNFKARGVDCLVLSSR